MSVLFVFYLIIPLINSICLEDSVRNDVTCSPCNYKMTNPKKIINPYRNELENYVPYKPFSSICLKCGICIAVATEMDKIFTKIAETGRNSRQSDIMDWVTEELNDLCTYGFHNYDLRKFNQFHLISDDFKCSTHVHTKEDGKWEEKLRQTCSTYLPYIDILYLFHDYKNQTKSIANYMCKDDGIFRDCANLNFTNTTMTTKDEIDLSKMPKICDL